MTALGIESTAHTLGIGITKNGKVLSNIHSIYRPKGEGIVPRKAADHHSSEFAPLLRANLKKAGMRMDDVSLIAYSEGPGIGATLHVGLNAAKYLALKYGKRLIGVNHPYAHIKISEHLTGLKNPLVLYVSGGNTQIIIEEEKGFRVLGETLDIGVGNLFDSFAREAGMEYAHGSTLEKLASGGKYVPLPYTVKGMNLTFSGLLTAAAGEMKKGTPKRDVAYSLFETAFPMLCEATERALFLTRKKSLVVCGGVAQNRCLQKMLRTMCKEDGVEFGAAPDEFNRDNGAMIAYAGSLLAGRAKPVPPGKWGVDQNYHIGKVRI